MKYEIELSVEAKQDIARLKKSGDKKLLKKLHAILTELKATLKQASVNRNY